MTRCRVFAAILVVLATSSSAAAQVGSPTGGAECAMQSRVATAPTRIAAEMAALLRQSPTLQRQCARLASESAFSLELHVTGVPFPAGIRARGHIARTSAGVTARITLPVSADLVELLAHELEHVIEQLDGWDLGVLSREADRGVTAHGDGTFETMRAVRAGRRARDEADRAYYRGHGGRDEVHPGTRAGRS